MGMRLPCDATDVGILLVLVSKIKIALRTEIVLSVKLVVFLLRFFPDFYFDNSSRIVIVVPAIEL